LRSARQASNLAPALATGQHAQVSPAGRKSLWRTLAIFLAVLGPGIITGSVDNDAGGITTYSVLGATYGFRLLWILIPSFIVLVVVQEMNARMGMVTGKGLADLIRENFGVKITLLIFLGQLVAGIGNTATEFAGVAGSLQVFGISKYATVPMAAAFVWVLAVRFTYKSTEKIFLVFSLALLSYAVSAFMARPDWGAVAHGLLVPRMDFDHRTLALVIGTVGTTIAPWMQFYMQSSVIEKGLTMADYRYSLADVIVGSVATVVVAFFIIVACGATLHPRGISIVEAKDAAVALRPFAGHLAGALFALGLLVASVFSATILPIATSFYICEAFGFEAGIDKTWRQAPTFYALFTAIELIAVAVILIPGAPLITITLWTQILNGVLLPVVLVSMIKLINSREIMGEHVNKGFGNVIGLGTAIILVGLSVLTLVLGFL
jgi:NRAMP (natural resistance-associated macrophage protein)-like metal ion transporter